MEKTHFAMQNMRVRRAFRGAGALNNPNQALGGAQILTVEMRAALRGCVPSTQGLGLGTEGPSAFFTPTGDATF